VLKSMGLATIGFADALERLKPDLLLVLGDRYEALAMAEAALIMTIPIGHIHGGELTAGAYDDAMRHAITKMAQLHFVAAEAYRKRVIQMGEHPECVFNVGSLGLEQLAKSYRYTLSDLGEKLNFALKPCYFLVIFHPVTIGDESIEAALEALLDILAHWPEHQIVFTYPNADNGGHRIIRLIEQYQREFPDRILCVRSLGHKLFPSVVSHAKMVIGNSSSGIIEVPFFKIPTVNIGSRQMGRLSAESVIHSETDYASIDTAVKKAIDCGSNKKFEAVKNPYGDGEVSSRILPLLKESTLSISKAFRDIDF
jgi:UDP-2,4-diacetamido-2,4,6-trideoxy-beta-L-idose 2-epimerase